MGMYQDLARFVPPASLGAPRHDHLDHLTEVPWGILSIREPSPLGGGTRMVQICDPALLANLFPSGFFEAADMS